MATEVPRNLGVLEDRNLMSSWRAVISWARHHVFVMVVSVAALGALVLHIVGLSSSPPGFYVDEASIGYNAYAISIDGRDQNGKSWPLFIESYGLKNPVVVYLIAGAMRLFGPSVSIVRGVPSLVSLVTAVVLSWLVYQIFRDRWLGLATFVVAATLPWLFVIGRIGFEASVLPAALSLFLLAWWNADHEGSRSRRQVIMALLAGLSLGLAIYAYTTARLLVPVLVGLLWVAYLGAWRHRWLPLAVTSLVAMASYLPMIRWSLVNSGLLTAQINLLSITCRPASECYPDPGFSGANTDDVRFFPLVVAERFARTYSASWSPSFLFYSGDPVGRHDTAHGGMLYVTLAPFLIVGAVAVVRRWRQPFWRLIGLGALFGGVPAALTMHQGHALRTIDVVPFLVVIMALAGAELIRMLSSQRWIVLALGVAILVEIGTFMTNYFTVYPTKVKSEFDPGLQVAIDAAQRTPHEGSIVLTDRIDQPEIMFAFFSKEDPKAYRARGIAGAGATVQSLTDKQLPPGSVVVAKPDEKVANGILMWTITDLTRDSWGHSAEDIPYKVWLTF